MCKYVIPCHVCGGPVKVDQPGNSKIPIEIAYCPRCWKLVNRRGDGEMKFNDAEIVRLMRQHKQWLQAQGLSKYNITAIREVPL